MINADGASSTAGHFAFAKGNVLRIVSPDGQVGAVEPLASGASYLIVAIGARGDAIVAWIADGALWAQYRPASGRLGAVEQVAADASFFVESVPLGVDAAGNAIVGWVPASGNGLDVRIRAADGTWGPVQTLGGSDIFRATLAVSDNGGAVLAWRQHGHGRNGTQVAVSTRAPGASFVPARVLKSGGDEPTAALDDRGDAVVAWVQADGVGAVFRRRQGRFSTARRVSHIDGAAPSVAVGPDGWMTLAWSDDRTARVEARVRSSDGALRAPHILTHQRLVDPRSPR